MGRMIQAPCPTCGELLTQTRSGYWTCPHGHTRLLMDREARQPQHAAAAKANEEYLKSDEHKLFLEQQQQRRLRKELAASKRRERREKAAALPGAWATSQPSILKVECHRGLFRYAPRRVKGAIHVLFMNARRTGYAVPLSAAETDAVADMAVDMQTR